MSKPTLTEGKVYKTHQNTASQNQFNDNTEDDFYELLCQDADTYKRHRVSLIYINDAIEQ